MIYFAKIVKVKTKEYLVEFPELPGCLSSGHNLDEAKENAKEALDGWLLSNCTRELSLKFPVQRRSKQFHPVSVDAQIAFAITLRQQRKKLRKTQQEVADLLGIKQQAYARLESPKSANPSLKTLQHVAEKMNLEFTIAA